jgi:hypothetical protein
MPNLGGFYCPKCREFNACNCETCSKSETDRKRVKWDDSRDLLICQYCETTFHPDQSLEIEMEELQKEKNFTQQ